MIYPSDIYAKTKTNNKVSSADKAKAIMGGLLIINAGFTMFTSQFFGLLGIPLWFVILVQAIIYLFICVQIFRFAVFREQDREGDESDLFMPYYKVRPGFTKVKTHSTEYDLFEMEDNSFVTFISFKYGMNNSARAKHTEDFLNQIHDFIHESKLSSRFIVMNESFSESDEAYAMLQKANSIKDKQLRATQLSIYNEVLSFAEQAGTVPCVYLMIYSSGSFFKDNIEDVVVQLYSKFNKQREELAFRQIDLMDENEIKSMFKKFYGMDAMDLSLSKIQYDILNSDILKSISVYRIISKENKSFSNDIFNKVQTSVKFLD